MVFPVERLIRLYPAALQPILPPAALGNAGGLSGASLYRYLSGSGPYLVRGWPIDGPGMQAILQIHRWLSRCETLGVIPVPVPALDGRTLVEWEGRAWEVSRWIEGEPEAQRPPDPGRVIQAFSLLASFHQRLTIEGPTRPSPGIRVRRLELDYLIRSGFEELGHLVVARTSDPFRQLAERWLTVARRTAATVATRLAKAETLNIPIQPCLRDARSEHFLFRGQKLVGLIDFGALDLETVAADLARLLGSWLGPDPRDRLPAIQAYEEIRPLLAEERILIRAFEDSAILLGPGHWLRWHYLEDRVFNDPERVKARVEKSIFELEAWAVRSTSIRVYPLD